VRSRRGSQRTDWCRQFWQYHFRQIPLIAASQRRAYPGDDEFGTLFEKPNLGPPLSKLVQRLAASTAIPPSVFTPPHTPELVSTAPLTAVSIIATDVLVGRGFEVAKAYLSASAGDDYASRGPDSAKVGFEVCDTGRTWRRGNPGIVGGNTWRGGDGCEVDAMMNLFWSLDGRCVGIARRWMIECEASE
jgi:hypothetical protein